MFPANDVQKSSDLDGGKTIGLFDLGRRGTWPGELEAKCLLVSEFEFFLSLEGCTRVSLPMLFARNQEGRLANSSIVDKK